MATPRDSRRFTDEQLSNARTIIRVGRGLGASSRDILIALMTGFQESGLRNLTYGDRDSIGVFQQRNGWGSRAQRLNVAESSRMFFTGGHGAGQPGLLDLRNRNSMSLTQAAQKVQRSAFPDAYAKHEGRARSLLSEIGFDTDIPEKASSVPIVDSSLMPSSSETSMLADLGDQRMTAPQDPSKPLGLGAATAPGTEPANEMPQYEVAPSLAMEDLLDQAGSTGGGNEGGVEPSAAAKPTNSFSLPSLKYAANQAANGGQDWQGWCLRFVRTATGIPGGVRTANDAWSMAKSKHSDGAPPPGAAVFWKVGKHGHVALSAGGGYVYSTDILRPGKVDLVPISMIAKKWGAGYLGWTGDLNGHQLRLGQ